MKCKWCEEKLIHFEIVITDITNGAKDLVILCPMCIEDILYRANKCRIFDRESHQRPSAI